MPRILIVSLFILLLTSSSYAEGWVFNPFTGKMDKVNDKASEIKTETTNFNGALSLSDTTVQKALDSLDDLQLGAVYGLWQIDGSDDMMPLSLTNFDDNWEINADNDLTPKA